MNLLNETKNINDKLNSEMDNNDKNDRSILVNQRWELTNKIPEIKSDKAKDLYNFYFNLFVYSNPKNEFKPFVLNESLFNQSLKMLTSGDENSIVSEIPQIQEKSNDLTEVPPSSIYVVSEEEDTEFPDLLYPSSSPPSYDKNGKPKVKMKRVSLKFKVKTKLPSSHPPVMNFNDMNLEDDSLLFN
jgi:hypothetical protein